MRMTVKSKILRAYFSRRQAAVDRFRRHPHEVQQQTLRRLVDRGRDTLFGRQYDLSQLRTDEQFRRTVPTFDYETFKPFIERMRAGERDVSARGRVRLFARSSGTTSDRSKYIPVTAESVWRNHSMGMRDVAALYMAAHPDSRVLEGKTLTLGGSCRIEQGYLAGDLSALLIHEMRLWSGWFRAPRMRTALLADFDRKTEAICRECTSQHITAFAGVPSWNLALMRRVLEYTGRHDLTEVWPDLELFAHGGVEFGPYRRTFEELIPSPRMHYMETYNASEGFFAIADDPSRDDMLLMLDYGTYYEFRRGAEIVPLEGVRCGETYALIITSNNGLWRYEIGDTVQITSTDPYRIRFAGRTRQFINAFGEELIVDNAEAALRRACEMTGATVNEYTAGPRYMTLDRPGAHQWVVEFARRPDSAERFAELLDEGLRAVNSDYDAKRQTTLERLQLCEVEPGRFLRWMQARGKNKVARMTGDRSLVEEILAFGGGPNPAGPTPADAAAADKNPAGPTPADAAAADKTNPTPAADKTGPTPAADKTGPAPADAAAADKNPASPTPAADKTNPTPAADKTGPAPANAFAADKTPHDEAPHDGRRSGKE